MSRPVRTGVAVGALATVAALAVATAAQAHVVVTPGQVRPGSFATYTLSVPNEKSTPTTKVVLTMPKGFQAFSYEPVAGWKIAMVRTQGAVTSMVVRGNLAPGTFQRFAFVGLAPRTRTTLAWKAVQTYRGGAVVRWTGTPGSATPYSTTKVAGTPAPAED